MTFDFALQGLLPLIVFAIVDIFAGMRTERWIRPHGSL